MFGLGPMEIFVIGVIALIFIGPKKLPDLAKGLGKSIREFQRAKDDVMTQIHQESDDVKNSITDSGTKSELSTEPEVNESSTQSKETNVIDKEKENLS